MKAGEPVATYTEGEGELLTGWFEWLN